MSKQKPKNDLLIVGSVAFDSIETPDAAAEMALGGSASYASIAASYFARPMVVGIVGEDFDESHMERFKAHGVDTAGIERAAGKTFHWKGRYHDNFKERDTLETSLNVFEHFDPRLPEQYRGATHVFLGNIAPALQAKVLDQAGEARLVAMDTMNFWIDTAREDLEAVLRRVDIVFINDEEAEQLSGEKSVIGAAESIVSMGPKIVVIKRGEFGALLFGEGVPRYVPAVLLPSVVDPTGAGDTFAGGFMGALAGNVAPSAADYAAALVTGTVMASFAVESFSIAGIDSLDVGAIESRRNDLESMIGG